jgi:hypothetical protein
MSCWRRKKFDPGPEMAVCSAECHSPREVDPSAFTPRMFALAVVPTFSCFFSTGVAGFGLCDPRGPDVSSARPSGALRLDPDGFDGMVVAVFAVWEVSREGAGGGFPFRFLSSPSPSSPPPLPPPSWPVLKASGCVSSYTVMA